MESAGITVADLTRYTGTYDLGWNGTGVIRSYLHITPEEIVIQDEMPGYLVDDVMAEVAALSAVAKKRGANMQCFGKLPIPIWMLWKRQWMKGPRAHGVIWRAFLRSKLEDSDFSRFRVKQK